MADVYVVLDEPALVNGVEYDAGAVVAMDDALAPTDDFGTELTQDHPTYTAALWTSNNPTVASGHFGIELDTGLSKIGTGAAWNSTSYAPTTFEVADEVAVNSVFATYATATPALSDTMVINDTSDSGNTKVITLTQLKTALA